jgi:hypothetical protein
MCSEVLSWREESWWERKSIPLGSHSLSPRQLFLLASFGGLGDILSTPIPPVVLGIFYLGRALAFFAVFSIGVILGAQRIRTTPIEYQLFLKATKNRDLSITKEPEGPTTISNADTRA